MRVFLFSKIIVYLYRNLIMNISLLKKFRKNVEYKIRLVNGVKKIYYRQRGYGEPFKYSNSIYAFLIWSYGCFIKSHRNVNLYAEYDNRVSWRKNKREEHKNEKEWNNL